MLWAAFVFGFAFAQLFLEQHKAEVARVAIALSIIPLFAQLVILLDELIHLPSKYWIKLLLHRLLMNVWGDHGAAANLSMNVRAGSPTMSELLFKSRNRSGFTEKKVLSVAIQMSAFVLLAWIFTEPILRVHGDMDDEQFFTLAGLFVFVVVYHITLRLFLMAMFKDAFSGMLHTRQVSLAVWLEDEAEQNGDSFCDSHGRKVISEWEYPDDLEEAIPIILQDLDRNRMELLKRLNRSLGSRASREQTRLNGALEREKTLRWTVLGKPKWSELFEREKSFRWAVLDGAELTQELIKLEKLKLELERRERQERQEQQEQQEQRVQLPLDSKDFLDLLHPKRENRLEQLKQEESDPRKSALLEEKREEVRTKEKLLNKQKIVSELVKFWPAGSWKCINNKRQVLEKECQELKREQDLLREMEVGLVHEPKQPPERLRLLLRQRQKRTQLESLEQGKLKEMQALQSLMLKEPYELQGKQLTISKVIRNMQLEVIFFPSYLRREMRYSITATGSQESYASRLYIDIFEGYCDTTKAAEFVKLIEILGEDTFVVKRQAKNPLLLQVDKHFRLLKSDFILPCEKLEDIVNSVLKDGKKLNAVHVRNVSYV